MIWFDADCREESDDTALCPTSRQHPEIEIVTSIPNPEPDHDLPNSRYL